jgi:ABC-type Fe3+ transport system substrate-binding protein
MAFRRLYGEQGARTLISAYLQNGAQVRRGGQLQIQIVAAGEYGCALAVYINNLLHVLKQGAPLSYSVPEPVLLNPAIIMMTKHPRHPFGAMLLYDYMISPEGLSQITRNVPLLPPRDGLPVTEEIKPLQGKPSYFISVEDQSRNFVETRDIYNSLLKK